MVDGVGARSPVVEHVVVRLERRALRNSFVVDVLVRGCTARARPTYDAVRGQPKCIVEEIFASGKGRDVLPSSHWWSCAHFLFTHMIHALRTAVRVGQKLAHT